MLKAQVKATVRHNGWNYSLTKDFLVFYRAACAYDGASHGISHLEKDTTGAAMRGTRHNNVHDAGKHQDITCTVGFG